ncbi:MAG TPA: carbon storage regulator [Gemmataceae bacterium]|nr:carbon storage regulator [Gemmataceae bacterium]
MLVLARQLNERIVMPTVQATIEVVALKPGGVRLGIDAPPEVTILREEVLQRGGVSPAVLLAKAEPDAATRLGQIRHVLRNRLHTVTLGLNVLRQQLSDHPISGLETMLQRMEDELRTLDQQLRALLVGPLTPTLLQPAGTAMVSAALEGVEDGLAI